MFFAIGFETTTPPTALAIRAAEKKRLDEFLHPLQSRDDAAGDPRDPRERRRQRSGRGARSTASSAPRMSARSSALQPYRVFAENFGKPVVVAGFEPLDVAQAILMLVRQINDGRSEVENQYIRAVTETATSRRRPKIAEIFETARNASNGAASAGCPTARCSLQAPATSAYDAERRFGLVEQPAHDNPACECGAILRGVKKPRDCKLFGTLCTPDTPMGSCMVSPEGACSAHWTYGRFREAAKAAPRTRGASRERCNSRSAASSTSRTAASIFPTAPAGGRWGS